MLQCGYPKSGNSLLFGMLRRIQGADYKSFRKLSGITEIEKVVNEDEVLIFKDMAEVDNIRVVEGQLYLQFIGGKVRLIPVDPDLLMKTSSIVWTHSTPDAVLSSALADLEHKLYIYRDGRDVITSQLHHVTRPIVMRSNPQYQMTSVKEAFENLTYFEGAVSKWSAHVKVAMLHRDQFHFVRYEDLLRDKKLQIEAICAFLKCEVEETLIDQIVEETSFERTKSDNKDHNRKGVRGDWENHYDQRHKDIFKRVAGAELIALGYEEGSDW